MLVGGMFSKQTTTLLREDFHDDSSFVDSPSRSRHRSRGREDSESADAQFHDASDEVLTGAPVTVAVTDGLGIKERDKILDDLRKENFNLKLRIFFLEERLESWCIDGDGKKSKENVLLKMQSEIEELELDLMDERENSKRVVEELSLAHSQNQQLQTEVDQLRKEMHSFKADAEQAKDMEIELNSIANASDSKIDPNIPKLKGVAAVKSRIQDLLNSKKSLESKVSLISAENDTLQRQLQSTKQSLEVADLNLTSAQKEGTEARNKLSKAAEEILELKGAKSGLESALKESSHAQDRLLTKLETSARELEGLKMKLRSQDNDALLLSDLQNEHNALKQTLAEKTDTIETLNLTIQTLSVQLTETQDRLAKSKSQSTEHNETIKNLQHQLRETKHSLTTLQTTHHHVQSAHEQELADLHDHFSRLAQEKATQLEELIQARQKSKSPTLELMKLRAEHSTEIELYRQQLADFERLSEIAATEMGLLKNELEAQTRKLGEIEERWRGEKVAREAAVQREKEDVERVVRECEDRWRNVLEEERRFMKNGERGWSERCDALQCEVSALSTEVGRLRGELEVRVVMHEEAQRKFGEENGRLVEEKNEVEKELERVERDREELIQLVQGLQEARNEQASQGNDHAEALKDILIWINTVLGLPEVDLSQINDVFVIKQHIRTSLEDFQQIRNYFTESLKSIEDAFQIETSQYAQKFSQILTRLSRFEEIIKKATLLQKKLKSALEQTQQELSFAQSSQGTQMQDLDSLRNHLFAVKNELLVSKTEIEDMRGDLERKDTQVRELNIALDGCKKEVYSVKMDYEQASRQLTDIKEELKAEKEYSEKVEAQFQRLEEMEKESRREIESLELELREADSREAMLKEKVRMGESLNKECTGLEHEIAEIQKQRHNEQKALDSKIRELEEELNVTRRQLEITEKHVQNLKETKLTSPLTPGFDDPANLVSANDRLRADYFHSRRLVEEKEQSLQELRNQFTEVIHKLENSRLKHISREERYRKTIGKAIEHLERFNLQQGGMEVALDILKEKL